MPRTLILLPLLSACCMCRWHETGCDDPAPAYGETEVVFEAEMLPPCEDVVVVLPPPPRASRGPAVREAPGRAVEGNRERIVRPAASRSLAGREDRRVAEARAQRPAESRSRPAGDARREASPRTRGEPRGRRNQKDEAG